ALEGAIDAVASQTGVTAEVVRATTSARYVRYTIESTHSGTNELDISQLQIFDVDGFILNRSGWTATSSSTTGDASHVVGGSSTQFITGAAEPLPITLTVDMGVEQIVSMSRFQQTDGTRRIKDLLIETSTDGSTWRTAFSGDVEDTQWATNAFDEVRIVLSSEAPIVLEGAAVEDGFRDAGARGTLASTPLDLEVLDLALTELSGQLASVGAQLSGTERLASHLSQGSDTLQAARARVEETDYTQESRRFARSRILQSLALGYRAQAFEGLARIVDELL
ncbi:MAG: discoidin domain-containing protein, partial [Myxococcota bacterium]